MSQEKSKTMPMQIFGGKRGVLWDLRKLGIFKINIFFFFFRDLVLYFNTLRTYGTRKDTKCRKYCFGLLGHISAVLMSRMAVKLINPPQMSHTCGTSKPCQSAQTSELVSMRNC